MQEAKNTGPTSEFVGPASNFGWLIFAAKCFLEKPTLWLNYSIFFKTKERNKHALSHSQEDGG